MSACFTKRTRIQPGQFITTSAEVTPNGGLVRESPPSSGPSHLPEVERFRLNAGGAFFAMGSDTDLVLEDDLGNIPDGTMISVVADIIQHDFGVTRCSSQLRKTAFLTSVDMDHSLQRVTILQGIKQSRNGEIWIDGSAYTTVYQRTQPPSIPLRAVEVCAGISAMGDGLKASQIQTQGYVEYNTVFCQQLLNQGKTNVIEGNVADISTVVAVARRIPNIDALVGGVACQPFSSLGDRREQHDKRSESLPGMIRMGYLLQVPYMIVECTKEVLTSQWSQQLLQSFVSQTDRAIEQQVLHIHTMWPSHRTRWWAIITPRDHPIMPIPHFPDLTWEPSILHLMPVMMKMNQHDLRQLELDLYELRQFHSSQKGIGEHTLKLMKAMPTATHSWGSQVTECKCGCRSSGFSSDRIAKHGLYGILWPLHECVKLGDEEVTKFRHLHPKEVALLCGMNPVHIPDSHTAHLRLSLAGVGQMASPLHAAWVGGHLVESLMISGPQTNFSKHQAVAEIVEKLFRARDALLPHAPKTRYMELFEHAVRNAFVVNPTTTTEENEVLTQELIDTVMQAEQETNRPDQAIEPDIDQEDFPDETIRQALTPVELPSGGAHMEVASVDPYWECPYDDCFICHPEQGLSPMEAPVSDGSGIIRIDPVELEVVSSTIPFTVREEAPDDTKPPGSNKETFLPPLHKYDEKSGDHPSKVVPFDSAGGVPGFQSTKRKGRSESSDNHDQRRLEISQGLPNIKDKIDGTQPPPINTHERVASDIASQGFVESKQQRVVQVVYPESHAPAFVKAEVSATVGDLMRAEAQIANAAVVQAFDSLGQELHPKTTLKPFQRIHIYPVDGEGPDRQRNQTKEFPRARFESRFHALLHQGPLVASDEMQFYLGMVSKVVEIQTVPPLIVQKDADETQDWVGAMVSQEGGEGPIVSAILMHGHWVPVVMFRNSPQTIVHTSSEGLAFVSSLFAGFVGYQVSAGNMQTLFSNDCGFQTVGWIAHVLQNCHWNSTRTPTDMDPVLPSTAGEWRSLFDTHLHATGGAKAPIGSAGLLVGGAKGDSLELQLTALLTEHGVYPSQVEERSNMVLEKLGRAAVMQACRSSRPWQELKAVANAQLPKVQLILPSELSTSIKARLDAKTEFGHKKVKQHPDKKQPVVIQLLPEDLTIPGMIFKQGSDEAVQQIPFSAIGVDAKGVILVTADQAKPYLALPQPISKHGLALLVLDHSHSVCGGVGQVIRFPAQCQATMEPIIATARLIQLGQIEISRHLPESQLKVDEVQTSVIRVVVYRDETEADWPTFVQHPVKHVLQQCSELQTAVHPDLEILDVWDRQFVNMKLEKVKATESSIFIVTIRVKGVDQKTLMTSNSVSGIYIEPRTDDGRKPSLDYRVVWLQKVDKATAVSSVQSSRQWASLVRSGQRYGIRTTIDAAEAVHQQHKPNTPYIDSSTMMSYMVGPWPYGATRSALQKIFVKWGWEARPLQPRGRSADATGVLWEVQAAQKPRFEVYSMEHSDVLITEIHKKRPIDHQPSDVLASAKTLAVLKTQQKSPPPAGSSGKNEIDPLMVNDPWKNWSPPHKVPRASTGVAPTPSPAPVEVIQAKVERKFAAAIAALEDKVNAKDVAMGSSESPDMTRVADLEARMNQLEGAVQQQSAQLQQHQTQVTHQVSQIQTQVDQQASPLQRHLDQRLQEQLGHIERLLHKKPRDSNE